MAYPDFEEFIGALNAKGVRYLVVGAHAVAFHARAKTAANREQDRADLVSLRRAQRRRSKS